MKNVTKKVMAAAAALSMLAAGTAFAADDDQYLGKTQDIIRAGTYGSVQGPAQYFTGKARIDNIFPEKGPAKFSGAYVTFEPGARSNWHTHQVGQTLVVTMGVCLTGTWGGDVTRAYPGDVIQCPPGVKHWHGASPDAAMTHVSICQSDDSGNVVNWMEPVTDEQYLKGLLNEGKAQPRG